MVTGLRSFNAAERRVLERCRTPLQLQKWLRSIPYNWRDDTLWTLRNVARHDTANCIEAAIAAATIMEERRHPPLLLDLESEDGLDHVLCLFRRKGRWGSIGKSRDVGLHGRRPVFRTVRDLAFSYVDPYVDGSGRIIGYGVGDLRELGSVDWRHSDRNVHAVERFLIDMPHSPLMASDRRHQRMLDRFRAFKTRHPNRPFTGYRNRHQWL